MVSVKTCILYSASISAAVLYKSFNFLIYEKIGLIG